MTMLAQRLGAIAPAETMEMAAKAAALRRSGISVESLSQGEPDFLTPEHIQEAARRAMREGKTRYTESAGMIELREAIVAKMKRDHGLGYATDEVSVTAGAKQAIFNAFFATLNPGDEVIVPAPCWVSYPEIVKLCGGTPIVISCPRANGFKLTPEQLEAAITPSTKWLMLNSPSNPTGSVYSSEELLALSGVLARHPHVWILTDDIYEKLIYSALPFVNILQVAPELQNRAVAINGVSKAYAMTGWRIGYAVGPRTIIKAMNLVLGQSTSNSNSIAQVAASAAIRGDQSHLVEFRKEFVRRRDFVVGAVQAIDGLDVDTPAGAFYLFVSCDSVLGRQTPQGRKIATDRELVEYLLDEGGVALVSGSGFLMPGHFRLSYAASMDTLSRAMTKISAAISRLS